MDGNKTNIECLRIDEAKIRENITAGSFQSEGESHAEFSKIAHKCGLFNVYEEWDIKCVEIRRRNKWQTEKTAFRPDFLLTPTEKLLNAGWPESDSIVVDAKRSGIEIGPGLNQLLDYLSATYECGGKIVEPCWAFLWPVRRQHRALASLMANQRIGNAIAGHIRNEIDPASREWREVGFYCGESRILTFTDTYVNVAVENLKIGRNSGSR